MLKLFKKPVPDKAPTVKEYFNLHKAAILKLVAEDNPPQVKDYTYEFTSLQGHRYYSIPEHMAVPFQRWAKGLELKDWMQNGITAHEFDRIRAEQTICMAHINAKTKDAEAKLKHFALLNAELDRRRTSALPLYVIINLCANYLIREDENPMIVSAKIHEQKCDDIENEIENGRNAFFLTLPQLKILNEGQSMSQEGLTALFTKLQAEASQNVAILKAYSSWKEPAKDRTASTKV